MVQQILAPDPIKMVQPDTKSLKELLIMIP